MQIRDTIALVCFCAVVCLLVHPVFATDNATIYYNLGEQYLVTGEYERAINAFDNALASNATMIHLSDGLLYTYRDKAYALIQLGRFNDALETTTQGLGIYPEDAMLWNNKGYAFFNLGRYQDAVSAYDQALATDKDYTKGWINKGDALYESGRYQDAVDSYSQALTTDPGNTEATAGLARAREKASTGSPVVIIAALALVAIAGGAAYYLMKGRSQRGEKEEKTGRKK
jgi:tetratricopeptide (TPR) repeat protein